MLLILLLIFISNEIFIFIMNVIYLLSMNYFLYCLFVKYILAIFMMKNILLKFNLIFIFYFSTDTALFFKYNFIGFKCNI